MKLFLRLGAEVNENLRRLLRYRGDLSRCISQALATTDLMEVELVRRNKIAGLRGTTVTVNIDDSSRLKSAAITRACSVNLLANNAIANWLRSKMPCTLATVKSQGSAKSLNAERQSKR